MRVSQKALVDTLETVLEQAEIEDVPDSPVANRIVVAEHDVSGFRYQIVVSELAREFLKIGGSIAGIKKSRNWTVENTDVTRLEMVVRDFLDRRDEVQLAEVFRWSDTLRASSDTPRGVLTWGETMNAQVVHKSVLEMAVQLLMEDVALCLKTGGHK